MAGYSSVTNPAAQQLYRLAMNKLNPHLDENNRRVIAISVDPRQLLALIVEGHRMESWTEVQFDGVPDDAILVGHGHSLLSNCFILVVQHPSFDVVPEGHQPPCMTGTLIARKRKPIDRLVLPNIFPKTMQ